MTVYIRSRYHQGGLWGPEIARAGCDINAPVRLRYDYNSIRQDICTVYTLDNKRLPYKWEGRLFVRAKDPNYFENNK